MNIYLLALIGLIVVFAVGYIFYGAIYKNALSDGEATKMEMGHIAQAAVALYISSLAFIYLYDMVTFDNGAAGVTKGLYLGLLVGVGLFALPLYTDSPFFKAREKSVMAVLVNWVVAFAVLGIVVGFLR
jgi:hypothetical protein